MSVLRMNEIVKLIRKSETSSVDLVLSGETVTVGFQGSGKRGELVMLGGGYYIVTTVDGRKFDIGKGELIEVKES